MDRVPEIVESSTVDMSGRLVTCLVLAACSHEVASVGPDAADVDAAVESPADATVTCGIRTGQRGKTERTVRVAGTDRSYIVYLPADVDPQKPIPLVYVHHGYSMSAQSMFEITGYPALADAEHIAVAFPEGQAGPNAFGAPWNVGTDVCPRPAACRRMHRPTTSHCSTRSAPTSAPINASIATTCS